MKIQLIIQFILFSFAILLAFCSGITRNDGNEDMISYKIDLSYQFRDKTMFYSDTIKVDSNNVPINKQQYYYPKILIKLYDDRSQDIFSHPSFLDYLIGDFKDPLFFNKELNKEAYRFVSSGTFFLPFLVRIEKSPKGYMLYWKLWKYNNVDYNYDGKVVVNKSKRLSKKEWDEFIILVNKANFWNLKSAIYEGPTCDANDWNLEGVDQKRYQFVTYGKEIYKCGEYLVNLTDFTHEQVRLVKKYD